ncbi:type II toxin-antitoxin system RelE/ParE family toxin [Sphingomonas sp. AAP5]|uniref:type II toxin-antitoxin system RelE/ParE family toxin n=1 Tax=unclassified Sphingomonas TaxID=196159 RepID=UPI00105703C4|nr:MULTISPECIES: type II toxin-antitoxin system RelE/ParE family toxin [unclassified Sphingomonas]MDY7523789.1 type II toxin-antitoxin system RelE/ParE family toxin [Sphingomonas sp. 10B4]MEB0282966.1 type II toxin-antitoxin system RelE/ParE family toxin [Sphingomonas sp. 10B4]QBM76737.1 type II toxin-antitoxin system RelE/ParE family toxin [Sphingomonas sp. AAP5]
MRTVEWSDPAIADLEEIDDYWSAYSPDAAERIAALIEEAAEFVAATPAAGPAIPEVDARKWRVAPTDYLLLYRVSDTHIEVLRIRHARENWIRT